MSEFDFEPHEDMDMVVDEKIINTNQKRISSLGVGSPLDPMPVKWQNGVPDKVCFLRVITYDVDQVDENGDFPEETTDYPVTVKHLTWMVDQLQEALKRFK